MTKPSLLLKNIKIRNSIIVVIAVLLSFGVIVYQPLNFLLANTNISPNDQLLFTLGLSILVLLTILNFFRIFIGFNFKFTTTLILIVVLAYLESIQTAIIVPISIALLGYLQRYILQIINMHTISKSTVINSVSAILFIFIGLFYLPDSTHSVAVAGLVIPLILQINSHFANKIELKTFLVNLSLLVFMIFIAVVSAFLAGKPLLGWQISIFNNIIYSYPDLLFFLIIINVIIGRYTGLRLIEYYRFRKILFK